MNIQGKTKAVQEWLKTNTLVGKRLKINATDMKEGEISVNVVSNTDLDTAFIDGTQERKYTFALVFVKSWSAGYDKVNIEAMEFGEKCTDWITAQYLNDNMPDFGKSCTIRAIRPLQNIPDCAAVYSETGNARYQLLCDIVYWEKEA